MPNPDNPILVDWIDSAQPISAWIFLENKPRLEVIQCVSVGWVVGETDEVLMLAPNLGDITRWGFCSSIWFYSDT